MATIASTGEPPAASAFSRARRAAAVWFAMSCVATASFVLKCTKNVPFATPARAAMLSTVVPA